MRKILAGLLLSLFLLGCTGVVTDFAQEYGFLAVSQPEVYGAGLAFEGAPSITNLHDGFEQVWRGGGEDELRIEYRIVLDLQKKEDLKWQKHEFSRQGFEEIEKENEHDFFYCKEITEDYVICHRVKEQYYVSVYLVKGNDSQVKEKAVEVLRRIEEKM